jgi:hypothetical protein
MCTSMVIKIVFPIMYMVISNNLSFVINIWIAFKMFLQYFHNVCKSYGIFNEISV